MMPVTVPHGMIAEEDDTQGVASGQMSLSQMRDDLANDYARVQTPAPGEASSYAQRVDSGERVQGYGYIQAPEFRPQSGQNLTPQQILTMGGHTAESLARDELIRQMNERKARLTFDQNI